MPRDAQVQAAALLLEPFEPSGEGAVVALESHDAVTAMDQHVARRAAALAVLTMRVADYDELHGVLRAGRGSRAIREG